MNGGHEADELLVSLGQPFVLLERRPWGANPEGHTVDLDSGDNVVNPRFVLERDGGLRIIWLDGACQPRRAAPPRSRLRNSARSEAHAETERCGERGSHVRGFASRRSPVRSRLAPLEKYLEPFPFSASRT
jgi:hypothetical protein